MARTIAALYSSRAEAETAQARLQTQLRAGDVQILGQHDGGLLSEFRFSDKDANQYRQALLSGDYLLCASIGSGQDPARIVRILEDSSSATQAPASARNDPSLEAGAADAAPRRASGGPLFIGETMFTRGGAKVTYHAPDHLPSGVIFSSYEAGAATRRNEREITDAGLFQERTIEASEMGEVPLISRRAVVREEVVIRKTAEERTEVIRDTVRRTRAEVDDIASTRHGRSSDER